MCKIKRKILQVLQENTCKKVFTGSGANKTEKSGDTNHMTVMKIGRGEIDSVCIDPRSD